MSRQNDGRNTLTKEQVRRVEEEILLKPKVDWSEDELQLVNEWFYNYGFAYRGSVYLLREHEGYIRGNSVIIRAVSENDVSDIIQEWIIKFQDDENYNPHLNLQSKNAFWTYFRNGLDQIAANRQNLSSTKRTGFIEDVFSFEDKEDDAKTEFNVRDTKSLNPEEQLLDEERRLILQNLIVRLKQNYPRHAEALILLLEGKKYKEIAEIMNESLVNVKALIHRAKIHIKDDFKGKDLSAGGAN